MLELLCLRSILDFLPTISIPLSALRLELFAFRKTLSPVSSVSVVSAVGSVMSWATLLHKLKSIGLGDWFISLILIVSLSKVSRKRWIFFPLSLGIYKWPSILSFWHTLGNQLPLLARGKTFFVYNKAQVLQNENYCLPS